MRKALYILGDLDDGDVGWLAENGRRITSQPGETLIQAGQPIDTLYVVLDGRLSVVIGRDVTIAEVGAGDILGEMSFVEKRPPSVSVVARAESRLLAVSQASLREALKREPAFAARFYRALAVFLSDRLRDTADQLGYGDAKQRPDAGGELDEGVLDNVHIAGERMRRLLTLLEGRRV
ncbi:MAG: cyclic nucleotide-binding domain-containing protein [Alphaproteobacteria bacterium]